jgi:bifunctional non-homologous end joining protein LigD
LLNPVIPMEPKSSDRIPEGEEWIAQIKWDGVRVLTYYDGKEIRLFNRKANERTFHYPELQQIEDYCRASSVILDGEIIALGSDGKPSFPEVMRRDSIGRSSRVKQVSKLVPVAYMIFDLLYYDKKWVNELPLFARMELLSKIIRPQPNIQLVSSHDDGQVLFKTIKEHGLEGIVLKQKDSCYYPGGKKDVWLKVKNYHDLLAVVAGFTLNSGIVNALLLGLYDTDGHLWYIGHAGTGRLSKKEWRDLTPLLHSLSSEEQPFVNRPKRYRDAYWVRPHLTVRVKYMEWTEDKSLRQPSIEAFVDVEPKSLQLH